MAITIAQGHYEGEIQGARIETTAGGAVMAYFSVLVDDGTQQDVLRGGVCLRTKAGQPMERGLRETIKMLGWESLDLTCFTEPNEHGELCVLRSEFIVGQRVKVEMGVYKSSSGNEYSRIENIKPLDAAVAHKVSGLTLQEQFGPQFRAVLGGSAIPAKVAAVNTPAKPPAKPPARPKPPVATPPPPKAPARDVRGDVKDATVEEAWDAFNVKNDTLDQASMVDAWNQALAEFGKAQDEMQPQDWGKFVADLDNMPF